MRFYDADIPRIAVENPVSSRVFDMPPHTQEIQPWMFGHPYTKKTRLWLKGLPPLHPTDVVEPIAPYVPSGTGRKNRSTYGAAKRGEDAKERSKTFSGIAQAMAAQWAGKWRRERMLIDKWIPVSEQMPDGGKMVAVLCRYEFAPDKYILSCERYDPHSNMWHDGAAQYWFPLPEVPEEEDDENVR